MMFRPAAIVGLFALTLGACTFEQGALPELHFADFKNEPPRGNTVSFCHAYGCQKQTRITFGPDQLRRIAVLMAKTKKADTPAEERRAAAYAIASMYVHAGKLTGTIKDRPEMDFQGSGDPTQLDCVDHSTNTTSFLLVLQHNNFLKHHAVGRPIARGDALQTLSQWPHWTAILIEKASGERWAMDSWLYALGENPIVVEEKVWYNRSWQKPPKPLQ